MIFVDGQNLFHGARNYQEGYKIDVAKLKDELTRGYDLIRAYWFDSFEPGQKHKKEDFFRFLEMNGFRVDAKPLKVRDGTYVEKGADISLATELIARGFNDSYEVAIVITGDNDFERAIRYVQDQGKIVKIATFGSRISSDMKRVPDEFILLDEIADDIEKTF